MANVDFGDKVKKALDMLKADDDLFTEMVDELDSWDGFADGFRAWEMCCLDDFYCGVKATKLLEDLTSDFNISDDYFYFTIYGLESTNDKADLYRTHTDAGEVYDNIIKDYEHLNFYNADFAELIGEIVKELNGAD